MKNQMGLSIVETMIGITIGLIVASSAAAFYISTLKSNIEDVRQQRFAQSVQILKYMISSGIRRAGYSNSTTALPDVEGWTSGSHYYSNGSCALITYVDMSLPTPKQQFYGYKLDTTTGIIYSYQADDKVNCSETGTWEPMNDPNQIKFSEAPSDPFFSSTSNPKLIQMHLIAEEMESKAGTNTLSREVLVKVFIRND